jgi:hypothetical protein
MHMNKKIQRKSLGQVTREASGLRFDFFLKYKQFFRVTPTDKSLALSDPCEMTCCTVYRESSRSEVRSTPGYLKKKKKGS